METDEDLGMVPGEQAFSAAADRVQQAVLAGPPRRPSEARLLQLYGLYKQATAGDCSDARPWFWRVEQYKKWSAWAKLRGTTQQQAMARYAQLADSCLGPDDPQASGGGGGRGGGLGGPVMSRMVYSEGPAAAHGPGGGGGGGGAAAAAERVRELAAAGDEAALAAALDAAAAAAAGGPCIDSQDPESGCSALHFAADRGRLGAVKLLAARGADLNLRDAEGQTALHYAALCGHREVYDALLEAGADPSIVDDDGTLPTDAADW